MLHHGMGMGPSTFPPFWFEQHQEGGRAESILVPPAAMTSFHDQDLPWLCLEFWVGMMGMTWNDPHDHKQTILDVTLMMDSYVVLQPSTPATRGVQVLFAS